MKHSRAITASAPTSIPYKASGVPMLDLSRQYAAIGEEVRRAIEQVCASQHYIMGEAVADFENSAANFLGTRFALGCASGTDAIWLALAAAGVGPGDEVITTPFSFFATASAIIRTGAKPIFVDVDPATLNIDPVCIEKRMQRASPARIKALLSVHLYGQCADMDELSRIAAENKLALVEDAAQAFGSTWRGKRAGSLGTAAAFSFYPTKNLSCYGDGGLVTTDDEKIADHIKRLRNHGSRRRYSHEEMGWNSRLDSIQAAILSVKMKYIEGWNTQRNSHAGKYDQLLQEAGLTSGNPARIRLLHRTTQAFHIYHQYVVRVERRDDLRAFLSERKIGSEVYYPVPLHLQQCFSYLGYGPGDLPESERAAADVLALPIYPEITQEEQSAVVSAIADFYS